MRPRPYPILLAVLLLAAPLLASCNHLSAIAGRPGPSIPPVPPAPVVCPAPVAVRPNSEPLPPAGFTEEDFAKALVAWFGPDTAGEIDEWLKARWRPWARQNAAQALAGAEFCAGLNKPPSGAP